jgi:putative DNA-invertase from lambdoid prophage Rac
MAWKTSRPSTSCGPKNPKPLDITLVRIGALRTIMAGLAWFERDLIRERVKSGLETAQGRGVILGRRVGHRPSDKKAKKVLVMHHDGLPYHLIGRNVGLSTNTVMEIVRRDAKV